LATAAIVAPAFTAAAISGALSELDNHFERGHAH
jgi:hypothetical protein